ncbi:tetratricopeptide repeat protein [Pseudomonas mediterranea]|uniref:tetratricopeptide repeat protein n=1 Tax=Pseudomonas mediterranea TaxID=183795 RepID=UPI00223413D0|nr:tetratricopeptide repeat protein [Pseudomonas mediterranea]UZE02128.1 tetratricopeptide repeat protein [Pseudomonas mediterranea]
MPAPLLATAGITDRIEALNAQDSILPFDVKALKRDIERLMAVNAAEAYMLFGMLNATLGDYEGSKEMHLKGLRLSMDEVGLVNYGISMRKVGRIQEAKLHFTKAFERSPSPDILEKIVYASTLICDYEELELIVERFNKANPDYDLEGMECMDTFRSIEGHLKTLGIAPGEYKLVGEFIQQAMIEFGLVNDRLHVGLSSFEGVSHLYLEVPLPVKNAHQLVAINDRISELVLSCDDITNWDRLVVNFIDSKSVTMSAVA